MAKEGRMREDALPSKTNQALFVREFVKLANEKKNWNYKISLKHLINHGKDKEGAVGGYWGFF